MKIIDATVDWILDFSNDPRLQVLVDAIPRIDELEFEQRETLFFAEKGGFVVFFTHSGSARNEGGYCNREFGLHMKDGTEKILRGPWSSRAGVMNREGFTPCVEVSMTADPDVLERGHTFYGCAITAAMAKVACEIAGCHLVSVKKYEDETYYIPSTSSDSIVKPVAG